MNPARCLLLIPLLLCACNSDRGTPEDPANLQSAAAEAAVRHVIAQCSRQEEAELSVILIGDEFARPTPEFLERFKDVPGLSFIDSHKVVWGTVGGVVRRYEERSGKPVLDIKITKVGATAGGAQEAWVAWAWQEEGENFHLELKPKPAGGYDIRELARTALKSPPPKADGDK